MRWFQGIRQFGHKFLGQFPALLILKGGADHSIGVFRHLVDNLVGNLVRYVRQCRGFAETLYRPEIGQAPG
jgi:hypothetical protein